FALRIHNESPRGGYDLALRRSPHFVSFLKTQIRNSLFLPRCQQQFRIGSEHFMVYDAEFRSISTRIHA
ncbi:hypothetical protein PFISCL1PPCAC_13157, partial [Pristionchus fissidentatus]